MVINPSANHVRILLCKLNLCGLAVHLDRLVITEVVSSESLIAPEHHFAPQVGMLATVVHCDIGFKVLLYVNLVLLQGEFNIFVSCRRTVNAVEVSTNTVLLVVEPVEVRSSDSVHMLSHQLSEHSSNVKTNLTCKVSLFAAAC